MMTMKNTGIGLIYFVVEGGGITKYWTLLGAARQFILAQRFYLHPFNFVLRSLLLP